MPEKWMMHEAPHAMHEGWQALLHVALTWADTGGGGPFGGGFCCPHGLVKSHSLGVWHTHLRSFNYEV